MKNYEVTFIVDPVLSGDEIKATAQTYVDQIKKEGFEIIHVDEMGLRTLAYPINRRNSGVYFTVEFQGPNGELIDKLELALRRDERIMRFLCIKLDKYGVKYNEDKRNGLIGKVKKKEKKSRDNRGRGNRGNQRRGGGRSQSSRDGGGSKSAPAREKEAPAKTAAAPTPEKEAPAKAAAPAPEKEAPAKTATPAPAKAAEKEEE
ncbi:MAG: 30S ribosomal protein S6 [Saprospiraceae bacterium]|nr:30S ribosomal protein S6 [Saprospiraceae bacterium]